ncbi:MAG: hypothetical protein V3T35_13805 [Spirochaetia bacterium]
MPQQPRSRALSVSRRSVSARAALQPQVLSQAIQSMGHDSAHDGAAHIERDPVRLLVVERLQDPLSRVHASSRLLIQAGFYVTLSAHFPFRTASIKAELLL